MSNYTTVTHALLNGWPTVVNCCYKTPSIWKLLLSWKMAKFLILSRSTEHGKTTFLIHLLVDIFTTYQYSISINQITQCHIQWFPANINFNNAEISPFLVFHFNLPAYLILGINITIKQYQQSGFQWLYAMSGSFSY